MQKPLEQSAPISSSSSSPLRDMRHDVPLVLDLDGTLIRSDMLFESFTVALKRNPKVAFLCIWWLLRYGKSYVKNRLAQVAVPDIDLIPVNEQMLALAEAEAANGRTIIMATASDSVFANRIAKRFPFISRVLSSDGVINLKGHRKASVLVGEYPQGFIYAGDSKADYAIWRSSQGAILVETPPSLTRKVKKLGLPVHEVKREKPYWRIFIKAIRLQQWVKNSLIFVPVFLAGRYADPHAWGMAILAFIAMGLVASATYLVNDLSDIAEDRRHWSKRNRPLAAATMPIMSAFLILPVFLLTGLVLAASVNWLTLLVTLIYGAATLSYSLWLKRIPILDTVMLAAMFSLRLLLGVVAIQATISPWLFVFSMALFLSISLAKRHTEVLRMQERGILEVAGRGYKAVDEPLLLAFGTSAAISAIAFMSLYLMAESSRPNFYSSPQFLWITPVAILLWLGRIWILSQRGELDDDPVAFAVRDRVSLVLGGMVALSFILAVTIHIAPWLT